jgi:hypothetical protein
MNDSFAARDFMNRLPMTVTGEDSGVDYCCELEDGAIDETELQDGWKNGRKTCDYRAAFHRQGIQRL